MIMEYFIKFSAILLLFWCIYMVFLQSETFFNTIRAYFVVGIVASLLLPFMTIYKYVYLENVSLNQISGVLSENGETFNNENISLSSALLGVYAIGFIFLSVRFLLQLFSLVRFITRHPKKKEDGYIYIDADSSTSPFSFFNYIIYPTKGFDPQELKQIIEHEKIHASQFHSLDILLAQLMIIFNWFNPIAWLYHREMQKNLEFIADQGAQTDKTTRESYQYLLLKTVTPNYSLALTSNFYNSLIKKRINMLQKNKSANLMYLKFIFIIPLLIVFVFTFNTKVIAQEKKGDVYEVRTELDIQVITKDFQKSDLSELKTKLLKKGINLEYKKLKYNDKNEIIAIQVSVSNKQNNKTEIQQTGSAPIKPISIKFDDKGALAVGNLETSEDQHVVFASSGNSKSKNVIVVQNKNGTSNHVSNMSWVTDDGEQTEFKVVNGNKVIVSENGDVTTIDEMEWISEAGDSTKTKNIEIIEIEKEDDGKKTIMIRKSKKDDQDMEVTVKSFGNDEGEGKAVFISDDGGKPLLILDGVEKPNMDLDEIDAEDIEKIEVFKGDKAFEKYGQKAKDGVIMITTKK